MNNMSGQERMPFGGDETPAERPRNTGLKISNANSKFTKVADEKKDFERLAGDLVEQKKIRNKRTIELASQFLSVLRDKTLSNNKSELSKNIEKDICAQLVNLSLEINSDDTETEGMGSVAIINLLLKTTLIQRDLLNELDYKVATLTKMSSLSEKK